MIEKESLMKALRDVFDAGRAQGNEEAMAHEWGSRPQQTPDQAFSDFMAEWNTESAALREILDTLSDPAPAP